MYTRAGHMESGPALLSAFLEHTSCPVGRQDDLQSMLEIKFAAARRAWPALVVTPEAFGAWLGQRVRADEDVCEGLARLREGDLYLTCATLAGAPHALETFERTVLARVPAFVARIDPSPSFADEVAQALRVKLLLPHDGDGKAAKLSGYTGRGGLESWVCAVATRMAIDLVRVRRIGSEGDELDVLPATDDPELEVLRVQHREAFRAALQQGLAALEPRQRTLLRLYFLEHVTFQALGRVYQVHETTAMRWIEQAKATVVAQVQSALRTRLKLSQSEFDSLAQLMQSQLDLSIGRLLSSRI